LLGSISKDFLSSSHLFVDTLGVVLAEVIWIVVFVGILFAGWAWIGYLLSKRWLSKMN